MDKASKSGLMDLDTRANGAMEKQMARVSYTTPMVTFMRATGSMIKLTDRVSTHMLTVLDIKVHGEMTSNTVSVWRLGPTTQFTKESTTKEKRMELVSSLLLMDLYTEATSR